MPTPRSCLPPRTRHGLRVRRTAVAVAAGALMLVGIACTGATASSDTTEETSIDTVAALAGIEPSVATEGVVAGAVSEAPAVDEPAMPSWVVNKLEAEPPKLALTYPAEGTTFTESYVLFSGKAEPGSTVAAGPFETKADKYGQWNIGLVLGPGQNTATFTVIAEDGTEITKKVTVNFVPPPTVEKKHDKDGSGYYKDHAARDGFEAYQKYGFCGDAVPYDVFKGYADPGTTISVTSPYGNGTAVAGEDGYWKVKVTFEDAPVGEPFTVTVSDGTEVKTFTFTRKQ